MSRLITFILGILCNAHSMIVFITYEVFQFNALSNKNLVTTMYKNKNYIVDDNSVYESSKEKLRFGIAFVYGVWSNELHESCDFFLPTT